MKQINAARLIILVAGVLATVQSCRKSSTGPVLQSWTIDTTTYIPTTVGTINDMIYATDSIGLITFVFASLPTSGGTYTVGDPAAGPNKVYIEARTGEDYISRNGIVTVKVNNGKISVEATDVWMLHVPMFTDSVKLSAYLTEQ